MGSTDSINLGINDPDNLFESDTVNGALLELVRRFNSTNNRLLDAGGESVFDRIPLTNSNASASGQIRFAGFICQRSEVVKTVRLVTGGTAAGPTPTFGKVGVYHRFGANWVKEAESINDINLFNAANSTFNVAMVSPMRKIVNEQYLVAQMMISAAALPVFQCPSSGWVTAYMTDVLNQLPRLTGALTGQTDLPASIPDASIVNTTGTFHALLLPT